MGLEAETASGNIPEAVLAAPRRKLVLGLGNPGPEYSATRHNVGFRVVEELAGRRGVELGGLECNAVTGSGENLLLALPQTYMNRSGLALRCLLERSSFGPDDVLVVYDDVALPLGRLRLRVRGGPGGHRGMESVIENLRTEEVARLRCGIAAADTADLDLVRFVLEAFGPDEEEAVAAMVGQAAEACEAWLDLGPAVAMNRYNG
ncbi:MAG: aminoacyl-tRNA hydrolase [Acidobacteria bacterium]|nr:aminoacyl-tRNA hydrolase [Acidobacteriota bacterium]